MSARNPLVELGRYGVSVWYDNISRALLDSGELARLMAQDGVKGVTTNPTIFEKAVGGTLDYDEEILKLAREGASPESIFETLSVEDVRRAADLFEPLYRETEGRDGFVSLELPPRLARDAQASHAEALRLHKLVGRPNVMIKIPGTAEGVAAFEEAIADGIPVNVTLLFSQRRYGHVAEAYLRGLERRAARHHKDLSRAASVASFFVSRVDTAVDRELERLAAAGGDRGRQAASLLGQAAVCNAKLAYQIYKREFGSPRFAALAERGARPQRLLWASTGTKNPGYPDTLYVSELIGADTVNTMPPATVDAFRDHGTCRPSLEEDIPKAQENWARLTALGIDLEGVADALEEEGLSSFFKSHETLMGRIAAKRELSRAEAGVMEAGLDELAKARFSTRLWNKEPGLWKADKDHQKIIKNSLGWLSLPEAMAAGLSPIRTFAAEVAREKFDTVVVLGMGGSSLACEVFRTCLTPASGHPRLEVLDSTHPAAVGALESRLDLKRTLFIVSSKSGSTLEPNCLMDYFFDRVSRAAGGEAGKQFTAITDPGTSLEKTARSRGFRRIFTSPADVGGRFSALSHFGLVPAAAAGLDAARLLDRARAAARGLSAETATGDNPALRLGAALACHARRGQDKLTLSLSPALESFGLWIEQLVAESTGKEGRGIVPIHGEPLGEPSAYGRDRLFVRLSLPDSPDHEAEARLLALERAGHPVLTLKLADAYDLGAQFLIWEAATAAAGFLLKVNPFDQPDVESSKLRTKELLASLNKGGLSEPPARLRAGGLAADCDDELAERLGAVKSKSGPPQQPLSEVLAAHLSRLAPGDYCAVLSYLEPSDDERRELAALSALLRETTRAAVSVQQGPRYLHSTGQLYKGGQNRGVFLQLTRPRAAKLDIPGRGFDFAALNRAQALGDFAAMKSAGRRILRLDMDSAESGSLKSLANALAQNPQGRRA